MGVGASSAVAKDINEAVSKSWQGCTGQAGAKNITDITGLNFVPAPWCEDPKVDINQATSVQATCVLNNMQSNLAQAMNKLDAEVKGGLGIGASSSVSDIKNKLEADSKQVCQGKSSTNKVTITGADVEACEFVVVQDASDYQSCQLSNMQQQAAKASAAAKASTTGWFGGTWGILILAIIIIVIVIVIGGISYYFIESSQKTSQQGLEFAKENPEIAAAALTGGADWSHTWIIIIVIIIVILILYWLGQHKKKENKELKNVMRMMKDNDYVYDPITHNYDIPLESEYDEESLDDYYKPLIRD